MASAPDLSSLEQSEQESDKEEESSNEEDRGDHVYQSLDRERSSVTEPVYALPRKQPKVRCDWKILRVLDHSDTDALPLVVLRKMVFHKYSTFKKLFQRKPVDSW